MFFVELSITNDFLVNVFWQINFEPMIEGFPTLCFLAREIGVHFQAFLKYFNGDLIPFKKALNTP